MKYRAYRRCTRNFEEVYTAERETKALEIELDGVKLWITEQQFGLPIGKPQIEISVKDGSSYNMDLSTLIKKIST